ncbi:MAG: 50S ribosome-binding protein YggL, partial [Gemmatimonadaceae bacterium]
MSPACPIFGFDVTFTPLPGADVAALDALRADFAALLEPEGLSAEPGPGGGWRQTVSRDGGQATNSDREAVAAWAAARSRIAACDVGPLVDLSPSA